MSGEVYTTQDHEKIRAWVKRREGHAARVVGVHPDVEGEVEVAVGELRIGFPGYAGEEATEPISWEEFFESFDNAGLTFHYQETLPDGSPSNQYRIE